MLKNKYFIPLFIAMIFPRVTFSSDITSIVFFLLDGEEVSCAAENVPPDGQNISIEIIDGQLNTLDLNTIFLDQNCDDLVFELIDDGEIFFAQVFDEELNFTSLFGTGPYEIIVKATDPEGGSAQSEINVTLR